jgi:hypothetical protein
MCSVREARLWACELGQVSSSTSHAHQKNTPLELERGERRSVTLQAGDAVRSDVVEQLLTVVPHR